MTKLLFIAASLLATSIAQAQTTEEVDQVAFMHSLVCSADAELSTELKQLLTDNQQAKSVRDTFQVFAKDPKNALGSTLSAFDEMGKKAKADLYAKYEKEIKEAAAQIAKEQNITLEEAEELLVNSEVQKAVAQQLGMDPKAAIVRGTVQSCTGVTTLQAIIAEKGCKDSTGAAIDITAALEFCSSIAPQMLNLELNEEQVNTIQTELQKQIEQLQQEAQANAAPFVEATNTIATEIYKTITDFVGELPQQVEIPLAPATTTP